MINFDILNSRWRVLNQELPCSDPNIIVNTIISGMTLHNFCCIKGDVWRDLDYGSDSDNSEHSDNVHAMPAGDNASLQRDAVSTYLNSPQFHDT